MGGFCFGQNLQMGLYGPRQLGMGMTAVGLPLDASCVYFNPGGMVWMPRRANVQFGVHLARPVTRFLAESPSVYRINMDTVLLSPISIYGMWKGRPNSKWSKVAFGLSINNPYQASTRWDNDWKGKYITQEYAITSLFIQPTAAIRVTKRLGVGLGISYAIGNLLSRKAIQIEGPNGTEGSVLFTGTGAGLGINAGISYKLSESMQLGLSYKSAVTLEIDSGTALFDVPQAVRPQWPDQPFFTSLPFPHTITFGLGYKPQEQWRLGLDISWTSWSQFDSLSLELAQPNPQFTQFAARNYANTVNLHMGGEYRVSRLFGRAGVYFRGSPVQQGFVSPEFPDANRIGLTAGAGILLFNSLSIHASYVYEYTGERTSALDEANFTGVYRSTTQAIAMSLGYMF